VGQNVWARRVGTERLGTYTEDEDHQLIALFLLSFSNFDFSNPLNKNPFCSRILIKFLRSHVSLLGGNCYALFRFALLCVVVSRFEFLDKINVLC